MIKEEVDKLRFKLNKKKCFLFGKGSSLKYINKGDNDLFICINDSLNLIKNCDILVLNDIESFHLIDKSLLSEVKFILTPCYPHFNKKPSKDITYKESLKIFKNYFYGDYIIYNLKTIDVIDDRFITLNSKISGANNALDFIIDYLDIDHVKTYGIGIISNDGYHDKFENQNRKFSNKYLKMISEDIIDRCKINSIKLEML
jgi:hypothetical protein